jgi:hypothetical protein
MIAFSCARGLRAGALAFAAVLAFPSLSSAQDIGFQGPPLAGSGPSVGNPTPTQSKPESKLWHHDGAWWGSLWSASALAYHIHRLDAASNTWIDTGAVVDARPDSNSDALVVGAKLYLVTHEFATGGGGGGNGNELQVLRFSYDGASYVLDAGFPVTVADSSTEAATIDRDSTGTLWVAWMRDRRVFFAHTLASDLDWSAPAILPGSASETATDDLVALTRFGGDRIGVLWSDQVLNGYFFSWHQDGDPDTEWSPVEPALAGESDDHVNLATDSAGRVFAAVKNAADETKLLVRDALGWQAFLVSENADNFTRPIVLVDESARLVHVFAGNGTTIQHKTSSLDALGFAAGAGTTVIRDEGALVNSPTSTKQRVDAQTGLVVLATNEDPAGNYWFHAVPGEPAGDELVLSAPFPASGGVPNTFTVTGGTPRGVVGFFVSMRLGASVVTRPQCPVGIVTELGFPFRRIGTAYVNASGVATLNVLAPPGTIGRLFHFQAVEPVSCRASNRVSNLLTRF